MFGGLMLGKFSKKCKQAVRCIKLRAEPIEKKKRVVVRILKKDVADLIAAGHESNAFRRMDALIVEMNLLFCYEMIKKFCECILNQLPTLQKQRECPEESVEAISTLIYAAARFSDLPELRDLRSLFTERYGNCVESSVNAEFAEKTNRKSFSREWKLKAMQEIAEELSVSWTCERNQESCNLPSPKSAGQAQTEQVSPPLKEDIEGRIDKHRIEMETKDVHVDSATKNRKTFGLQSIAAPPESNTESHEEPRRNHDVGSSKIEDRREVLESIQEEDIDPVKPLKPKLVFKARAKIKNEVGKNGNGRVHEKWRLGTVATDELENQPVAPLKMNPPYAMKPNMMNNAPKKLDGDSDTEKPKPFSVRKKLQKPPVNDTENNAVDKETHTDLAREELDSFIALGYGKYLRRGLSGEKGQDRRNAEAIQDERDEEEKMLDDLLLCYSRKRTDKDRTQSRAPKKDDCRGNVVAHQNENGEDHLIPRIKVPPPLKRTCSLPSESVSPAKIRVSSLQSDPMTRLSRSLVHPRLPDYDQLAARFAALKNG